MAGKDQPTGYFFAELASDPFSDPLSRIGH